MDDEGTTADDTKRWRRGMFATSASVHAGDWVERHWSSRLLHRIGEVVSHAASGILAALLVMGWAMLGLLAGFPTWWQVTLYSVTGSVTFVMVFVIQHTQQRQTAATQRKLDELLRSSDQADSKLIAVEEAPDEDLAQLTSSNVADRAKATA
jgi:low affinity Fe/Cu permease